MARALILLVALAVAGLAGCSNSQTEADGRPTVVATTAQMADFARAVGGDRIEVKQVLPSNADPHDYEPRPSDAFALADAELVLRSGGHVDDWLDGLIDSSGSDAPIVIGIDSARTIAGGHEHEAGEAHADGESEHDGEEIDPHWWQDPRNAERAVAAIERALIGVDGAGSRDYRSNARAYERRLRSLDRAVARCFSRLPRSQRKLVTTHDALAYYADRYGLEVVGELIPSLSTQAQPSSKDTRELVDRIRRQRIRAIFPESSINPKLERAVARETGAEVGQKLWADTLGPEGSGAATYIESIEANTRAIVAGVSGGRASCF